MDIFIGSAVLPSSLLLPQKLFFSRWGLWSVSCKLELQAQAVSISGLAGKSEEQEQALMDVMSSTE